MRSEQLVGICGALANALPASASRRAVRLRCRDIYLLTPPQSGWQRYLHARSQRIEVAATQHPTGLMLRKFDAE